MIIICQATEDCNTNSLYPNVCDIPFASREIIWTCDTSVTISLIGGWKTLNIFLLFKYYTMTQFLPTFYSMYNAWWLGCNSDTWDYVSIKEKSTMPHHSSILKWKKWCFRKKQHFYPWDICQKLLSFICISVHYVAFISFYCFLLAQYVHVVFWKEIMCNSFFWRWN